MIDAAAFHRDMTNVSAFGATPDGGVCRLTAGKEDGAARDWFADRLKTEGFEIKSTRSAICSAWRARQHPMRRGC